MAEIGSGIHQTIHPTIDVRPSDVSCYTFRYSEQELRVILLKQFGSLEKAYGVLTSLRNVLRSLSK